MQNRKTTPQHPPRHEKTRAIDRRQRTARDPRVAKLIMRSRELLEHRGVHEHCSVDVERRGRWFVLRGRVDSHRTRSQLFQMIPESEGSRWIVDHLRVDTRITPAEKS